MFENGVLGYIVGLKMDVVTRECKRSHNERHYDLKPAPYIIHAIKTKRMR